MNKVIIYSTPSCKYCKDAKEFFKKNKIEYEEIDVAADKDERKKMIEASGQMGVPVITINGGVFVGFDKEKLEEAFNIK